jgi:hypothetical protein
MWRRPHAVCQRSRRRPQGRLPRRVQTRARAHRAWKQDAGRRTSGVSFAVHDDLAAVVSAQLAAKLFEANVVARESLGTLFSFPLRKVPPLLREAPGIKRTSSKGHWAARGPHPCCRRRAGFPWLTRRAALVQLVAGKGSYFRRRKSAGLELLEHCSLRAAMRSPSATMSRPALRACAKTPSPGASSSLTWC